MLWTNPTDLKSALETSLETKINLQSDAATAKCLSAWLGQQRISKRWPQRACGTEDLQLEEFESRRFLAKSLRVLKKKGVFPTERKRSRAVAHSHTHAQGHADAQLLWFQRLHNVFPISVTLEETLSAGQVHSVSECEAADAAATEGTHNQHLNSTQPT